MSQLSIAAGMSNHWLWQAFKSISVEHAAEAKTSPASAAALKLTERRIEQVVFTPSVDTSTARGPADRSPCTTSLLTLSTEIVGSQPRWALAVLASPSRVSTSEGRK